MCQEWLLSGEVRVRQELAIIVGRQRGTFCSMPISLGTLLTDGLVVTVVAHAVAVVLLLAHHLSKSRLTDRPVFLAGTVLLVSALPAWHLTASVTGWLVALLVVACLFWIANKAAPDYAAVGQLLVATTALLTLWSIPWSVWFLFSIPVSALTRGLMLGSLPLLLLMLPLALVRLIEDYEVLLRERWQRPRMPISALGRTTFPKVSIHVPTHAEPPGIVIDTLNALARLHYPNFEVLVIDNNTDDPDLWQPVEAHCRHLGERFQFHRLVSWPGAKAGALNYALTKTASDAEIVGVVDADYQAKPDWLESLIDYFDDPNIGFVQPPHAYRDWEHNRLLTACNWEYAAFFSTMLPMRNERMAAITVGTMCLIRRKALKEAGGWAEWCATEDSELAPRIHTLGYSSVFVSRVLGRGLIPETFSAYKRQRYRWTVGPIQEIKRHWRLFLPRRWATPSALSPAQKLHHFAHGAHNVTPALGLLSIPVGVAIVASMLVQKESVPMPLALWLFVTAALITNAVLRILNMRIVVGCGITETLWSALATGSLAHTVAMGSLRGIFADRIPWVRTSKFKALPATLAALNSARAELAIGGTLLLGAAVVYLAEQPRGLLLMFLIGAALKGTSYMAAPVFALLAETELRRQPETTKPLQ